MALTEEQKRDYSGDCPFCGCEHVTQYEVDSDRIAEFFTRMECTACHKIWRENYTLATIED